MVTDIQTIVFSGREIAGLLKDKKFLKATTIATDKTRTTGHETGFLFWALEDKAVLIESIREGGTAAINLMDSKVVCVINGDITQRPEHKEKALNIILKVHFHPAYDGAIVPSTEDLNFLLDPAFAIPLVGIGQVGQAWHCEEEALVELLLISIRSRGRIITHYDAERWDEVVNEYYYDQRGVQELLTESGFTNCLLTFTEKGEGLQMTTPTKKIVDTIGEISVPLYIWIKKGLLVEKVPKRG